MCPDAEESSEPHRADTSVEERQFHCAMSIDPRFILAGDRGQVFSDVPNRVMYREYLYRKW